MKWLVYPVLILIAAAGGVLLNAVLAWDSDPHVGHGEGTLLPASDFVHSKVEPIREDFAAPPSTRSPKADGPGPATRPLQDLRPPPARFTNRFGMRFVYIQPGTFLMGSPVGEPGRAADETRHEVTLTRGFYMQTTEVTNALLRRYQASHSPREAHDSGVFRRHTLNADNQPAATVSWETADNFAAWLSNEDGPQRYGLPTEAQWEYACRAGNPTRFSWGASESRGAAHANANDLRTREAFHFLWPGWAADDGHRVSAPVGSYEANSWGLRDMHGNVMEWCADWYAPYSTRACTDPTGPSRGSQRVLRGGSWLFSPAYVRCAKRVRDAPHLKTLHVGFRLVAYPAR